jgi:hypothetical protein
MKWEKLKMQNEIEFTRLGTSTQLMSVHLPQKLIVDQSLASVVRDANNSFMIFLKIISRRCPQSGNHY